MNSSVSAWFPSSPCHPRGQARARLSHSLLWSGTLVTFLGTHILTFTSPHVKLICFLWLSPIQKRTVNFSLPAAIRDPRVSRSLAISAIPSPCRCLCPSARESQAYRNGRRAVGICCVTFLSVAVLRHTEAVEGRKGFPSTSRVTVLCCQGKNSSRNWKWTL